MENRILERLPFIGPNLIWDNTNNDNWSKASSLLSRSPCTLSRGDRIVSISAQSISQRHKVYRRLRFSYYSEYRITLSLPICHWHPFNAPTLTKKNANSVMTRSSRHRLVCAVRVALLYNRGWEVGDIMEVNKV